MWWTTSLLALRCLGTYTTSSSDSRVRLIRSLSAEIRRALVAHVERETNDDEGGAA